MELIKPTQTVKTYFYSELLHANIVKCFYRKNILFGFSDKMFMFVVPSVHYRS